MGNPIFQKKKASAEASGHIISSILAIAAALLVT